MTKKEFKTLNIGDTVLCTSGIPGEYTEEKEYIVTAIEPGSDYVNTRDDSNEANGFGFENFNVLNKDWDN